MKAATFMQPMNFLYPHSMHVRILKKLDDGDHRTNQYAGLQDEQTGHFPAYRLYVRFRRKMLQLALYPPDSGFDRVSRPWMLLLDFDRLLYRGLSPIGCG